MGVSKGLSPASAWDGEVVIAGGGPVGLALAVDLGLRGVRCCVVERRDRGRLVPRAKLCNVRTMEHMRRWGVADAVRAATPLPAEYSTDIAFVTSLVGHEISRFTNVFYTQHRRDERFAEPGQQIPQYALEPVLRARAEALPNVSFRDGWWVVGASQDPDGVDVLIAPGRDAEPQSIRGHYLVGCDGASSRVREQLGVSMHGQRALARNYGVVFRSPELSRRLPFAPALHFWTVNAATPSYMGPGDQTDLWWLQATAIDPTVELATLDPARVVRGALGSPFALEVINVDPWDAHALTAERVSDGRVMLAGDAAHVHSPMGAHGMNQGIGDAADLGWKLWAVLRGWAGPTLLESYGAERGPLHQRITEEATHNYRLVANAFVREGLAAEGPEGDELRAQLDAEIQREKRREFFSLGLILNYAYRSSPVLALPDGDDAQDLAEDFTPRVRVGARAPHSWLPDGASLFDRFGPGFTLLRTGRAGGEEIVRAAGERGVPLRVVDERSRAVLDTYGERLVLIRPDQVVAWSDSRAPRNATALLELVTGSRELGAAVT